MFDSKGLCSPEAFTLAPTRLLPPALASSKRLMPILSGQCLPSEQPGSDRRNLGAQKTEGGYSFPVNWSGAMAFQPSFLAVVFGTDLY